VLQGFESDGTDRRGQGREACFTFEGEHKYDVHGQMVMKPIYDKQRSAQQWIHWLEWMTRQPTTKLHRKLLRMIHKYLKIRHLYQFL
jgi:hypothetical protein